jgi:hypothetical protein
MKIFLTGGLSVDIPKPTRRWLGRPARLPAKVFETERPGRKMGKKIAQNLFLLFMRQ